MMGHKYEGLYACEGYTVKFADVFDAEVVDARFVNERLLGVAPPAVGTAYGHGIVRVCCVV